jgi:hypothetical protein
MKSVFILKDQIDQIWGVYSTRGRAARRLAEATSEMNDDNIQDLVIQEWELDIAWGDGRLYRIANKKHV